MAMPHNRVYVRVLLKPPSLTKQREAMLLHIDREIKHNEARERISKEQKKEETMTQPSVGPPPPPMSANLRPAGQTCVDMLRYFQALDRKLDAKQKCTVSEREYVVRWFLEFGPTYDMLNLSAVAGSGAGFMRSSVFELAWAKIVQLRMQSMSDKELSQCCDGNNQLDFKQLKSMLSPRDFYMCKWDLSALEQAEVSVYRSISNYRTFTERSESKHAAPTSVEIDRTLLSEAANVFYWHRLRLALFVKYPEAHMAGTVTNADHDRLAAFLKKTLHEPTGSSFEQQGRERVIRDHMPIGSFSRYRRTNTIYGNHFSVLDVMQTQLSFEKLRYVNAQSQCSVFLRDFKRDENRKLEEAKKQKIIDDIARARKIMASRHPALSAASVYASAASASSSSSSSSASGPAVPDHELITTAASASDNDTREPMDASTDDTWMLHAFSQWWLSNCHYNFYTEHCILWSDWGGDRKELAELADSSATRLPKLVCFGDNVWFVHHKGKFCFCPCPSRRLVISAIALWLRLVLRDFEGKHAKGKPIPNMRSLIVLPQ